MCCSAVCVGYWHGCSVAVKLLHKKLAKEHYQRRLFEQEVYVSSRLHHPNIAAVWNYYRLHCQTSLKQHT